MYLKTKPPFGWYSLRLPTDKTDLYTLPAAKNARAVGKCTALKHSHWINWWKRS